MFHAEIKSKATANGPDRKDKEGDHLIRHTFRHITGIGAKTEARLWKRGFLDWPSLLSTPCYRLPTRGNIDLAASIAESESAVNKRDPRYFESRLPARLHWRYFPEFRERTAYLDIETDGRDAYDGIITTIVLYDGETVRHYVHGRNLAAFPRDIAAYDVVVTYNGRCFDIPFIEAFFGIKLGLTQIDLRFVLGGMGYRGGLKGCEAALGIDRGALRGVDGRFAVFFWREYMESGDASALETLLAYNAEDVLNLERLMVTAYNMQIARTPFAEECRLPEPAVPANPFHADGATLRRIRDRYFRVSRTDAPMW